MPPFLCVFLTLLQIWPMYQLRPDHNAVVASNERAVPWMRPLSGKINGGLALAGGALFAETFAPAVVALDAHTGRVRWSTAVPNVVMTTPIVSDGLVIVGTGTSDVLVQPGPLVWGRPGGDKVIALDARTGRIRWRRSTLGEDMPSPALVRIGLQDAIVFANGDNHLRALSVRDGHPIWMRAVRGIDSMSSAASDGNRVYLLVGSGMHSGLHDRILAIDPRNGNTLWSAPFGNADCSPTVAYGRVFVEGSAGDARGGFNDVAAVDQLNGKLRWRWYSGYGTFTSRGSDEEAIAGLASDGAFYESIPATNQFMAFDAFSGRVRWAMRTNAAVKMSAVEAGGRLYFGDTGNTFYVVDARTGRTISRHRFPSYFTASPPLIVGGTLYIANDDVVRAIPLSSW